MSKRQFRSQASSSRAFSGAFGAQDENLGGTGFGISSGLGMVSSSPLSYVYEPPDLSRVSDPNMVVAFKNVQKKDGTTKAKALEDLQSQVGALSTEQTRLEDSVLEAWVGFLGQPWAIQCLCGNIMSIDQIVSSNIHR